jgi:hypothetical protein
MCSYRRSAIPDELRFRFAAAPPDSDVENEYYPGYMAPMIRRSRIHTIPGDRACTLACWAWCRIGQTSNLPGSPTTRAGHREQTGLPERLQPGQFCIIPTYQRGVTEWTGEMRDTEAVCS